MSAAITMDAHVRPGARPLCRHCGGMVPAGLAEFCCTGCAAAHALVGRLGLDAYYQRRTLDGAVALPRPEPLPPLDFATYARAHDDGTNSIDLALGGLHCAACIWLIENVLARDANVLRARINVTLRRLSLQWRGPPARANDLAAAVAALGYRVSPALCLAAPVDEEGRDLLRCLAVAGFAAANVMLISVGIWAGHDGSMGPATRDLLHWVSALIALPAVAYAGQPFFRSAFGALRAGGTNMDVPISIGVVVACGLSLADTWAGRANAYFESAAMLLFFLLVGRVLDRQSRARARAAVDHLLSLGTAQATRLRADGGAQLVPGAALAVGDRILVAAGERIAADGRVVAGDSVLDTSLVTGESVPRPVVAGLAVHAGMVNLGAPLTVQVTAAGDATLLAEMTRLLAAAEEGRGRYRALADRVARLYAPVVHSLAAMTLFGWLLAGADWHATLSTAIAVLIITCPCALALAVPAVQVAAVGALFRRGVLVKSPTALERLAAVRRIVFDKTGTLTLGHPVLIPDARCDTDALSLAAALAATSRHPLSRALVAAAPPVAPAVDAVEQPGQGIVAGPVRLGSRVFCGVGEGPADDLLELWLVRPGHAPCRFAFRDDLRADAAATVRALAADGFAVELLSGDRAPVVAAIAAQAGIARWRAAQRPAEKVAALSAGQPALMVGDGLNDAPALAAAHASMAPASGVDVARSAADVVFQGALLGPVRVTLGVARRAGMLARQNLALALVYNVLAVPLAVAGLVTPLLAAAAMSGSSLLVVANALRAGRVPR